jgi:hypothetical protein
MRTHVSPAMPQTKLLYKRRKTCKAPRNRTQLILLSKRAALAGGDCVRSAPVQTQVQCCAGAALQQPCQGPSNKQRECLTSSVILQQQSSGGGGGPVRNCQRGRGRDDNSGRGGLVSLPDWLSATIMVALITLALAGPADAAPQGEVGCRLSAAPLGPEFTGNLTGDELRLMQPRAYHVREWVRVG